MCDCVSHLGNSHMTSSVYWLMWGGLTWSDVPCVQKPQQPQQPHIIDLSQLNDDDKGNNNEFSREMAGVRWSWCTSHPQPLTFVLYRRFNTYSRPDLFTEAAEQEPISLCQPEAANKPC